MNKEELLLLLKNLSAIEGYLMSVKAEGVNGVFDAYVVPMVDLLWKKIMDHKDEQRS